MAGGTGPLQPGLGSISPSSETPASSHQSGRPLLWRPEESAIAAPVAASGSGSDKQAALSLKASSDSTASEDGTAKSSRHSGSLLSSRSSGRVSSGVSGSVSGSVSSTVSRAVSSRVSSAQSRASFSASATGQAAEVAQPSLQFVRLHEAKSGSSGLESSHSLGSPGSQDSLSSSAACRAFGANMSGGGAASSTASCSSSVSNGTAGSGMSGGSSQSGGGSQGSGASCVLSATSAPLSGSPQSPHSMDTLADDSLHGGSASAGAADTAIDQGDGSGGGNGGLGSAADAPGVRMLGAQLQPPLPLLKVAAAGQLEGHADVAASRFSTLNLSETHASSNADGDAARPQPDTASLAAEKPALAAPAHGSELRSGALYAPLSSVDTDHDSQQPAPAAAPEQLRSQLPASLQTDTSVAMSPSDVFQTLSPPPPPPPPEQQQPVAPVDALLLDITAATPASVHSLHVDSPDRPPSTPQTSGDELADSLRCPMSAVASR
jgi:hypothetical protein